MTTKSIIDQSARTLTSRRSFLLSESANAMASSLATAVASTQAVAVPVSDIVHTRTKKRSMMRAVTESARHSAFLHVLGELTYRSLPLDESEKRAYRDTILEQAAEMATSLSDWKLTDVGQNLAEAASIVADSVSQNADYNEYALGEAMRAAFAPGGSFDELDQIGAIVEDRVVGAIYESQQRSNAVEALITEAGSYAEGDAELDALRVKRAAKTCPPSLLESLFIANRRTLAEGTSNPEITGNVVMVEAVCQYTMLEAFSAIGVIALSSVDANVVAQRIAMRK